MYERHPIHIPGPRLSVQRPGRYCGLRSYWGGWWCTVSSALPSGSVSSLSPLCPQPRCTAIKYKTNLVNNSVHSQTHREGERMNISVTILNSHLSTSRNFQSCCHFDIFDLYEFTHKAMDFTSIKIFLRVFVVKLKLRKSKRKVSFTLI